MPTLPELLTTVENIAWDTAALSAPGSLEATHCFVNVVVPLHSTDILCCVKFAMYAWISYFVRSVLTCLNLTWVATRPPCDSTRPPMFATVVRSLLLILAYMIVSPPRTLSAVPYPFVPNKLILRRAPSYSAASHVPILYHASVSRLRR